jgi:rhodanese-related sulfurtransferase/predicted metal-dependent enzyme (double-stranded beta helix superfamily)
MVQGTVTLNWLDELDGLTGPLTSAQLSEITAGIAARTQLWRPLAFHDPSERWYSRLLLTSAIEVWLIGWSPGQGTAVHDHGGAAGAMTVTEGTLVEQEYRPDGLTMARQVTHEAGASVGFAESHVHRVLNAGLENATSVHAYSPPGHPLRRYASGPESDAVTVDRLLALARARLDRLQPVRAAAATERGALLVDIRPAGQRAEEGAIPGALVIERNVLEWRLDPASPWRIPQVRGYDQEVVVVCSEGYTSSLAAASLQDLGLARATDLAGGFHAWAAAGLPTTLSAGERSGDPGPRPDCTP